MEQMEVKALLEEWFNQAYPGDLGARARKTYAKLKVQAASECVPVSGNAYARARSALRETHILEEDGTRIRLITGSGKNNMNPTIVELCFEARQLRISAWAKEGLIPQKSAQRAIAACLEAMELN